MSLKSSFLGRRYYALLDRYAAPVIEQRALSPNALTLTGLFVAILVPLGFALHPFAGLSTLAISGVFDTLDGLAARLTGKSSRYGAFLDSTIDRISDYFYLFGFWILFWKTGQHVPLSVGLVFSSFLFTVLISYARARIEGLGGNCEVGFMSRAIRVVYLILWAVLICIFPGSLVLWTGIVLYWLLTLSSFLQRMVFIHKAYGES